MFVWLGLVKAGLCPPLGSSWIIFIIYLVFRDLGFRVSGPKPLLNPGRDSGRTGGY